MEKRHFSISANTPVAADTFRLELRACEKDFRFEGEFVDILVEGFYLRRPLSVFDWEDDTIRILYKVVGTGTEVLSKLPEGTVLDVLTGLGKGFNASKCKSSALLVGGGLGAAPLFPVCRRLVSEGKEVTVVLGFNSERDIVLEDEFKALGCRTIIATMDGSAGVKGLVTDAIRESAPEFDFFYCCGPLVMMKAVCSSLDCGGEVSLEERMGCGGGYCYGCSCKTLTGTKRICMDGPVFDKEEVIWN